MRPLPNQVEGGTWSQLAPSLVDQIVNVVHDKRWPLYLCGDAGRGKSFAMATVYRCWPRNPVVWIDFQPWLRRLMTARMKGFCSYKISSGQWVEMSEARLLEQITDARLLCIDDCGVRTDSEAQQSAFLEVLNMRAGRPTILTGNHAPESLHKIFDSRIASRMLAGTVLCLQGTDKRIGRVPIIEVEV